MSDFSVIAEYESLSKARIGLEVLELAYFTADEVSLISWANEPDPQSAGSSARNLAVMHDGKAVGLSTLIGGTPEAPTAIGSIFGPYMIAGGLRKHEANPGLRSILANAHPETRAQKAADYEERIKAGSVLIVVNVDNRVRLDDATNPLKTTAPLSLERLEPAA